MARKDIPVMKTIGVLGGMGPQATTDFVDRLHRAANKLLIPKFVNSGYPPLWVVYHRTAPMALTQEDTIAEPLRPHPKLLELARELGSRADFLVIPCNTAHLFVREIEEAARKPLLSIVDVAMQRITEVLPHRIGILAVGETLKGRLYQDRLEEQKIDWMIIPEEMTQHLDDAIYNFMEGGNPERLWDPFEGASNHLLRQGCDRVLLGCTELPLILEGRADHSPYINPNQLLAEAAIRYALT